MATSKFFNQSNNPYSAGAIVLDTTPITQYYLNEEAKRQAKDEALEKYYQDEMSKLSSEGMRSEDLPVFSEKFNRLKQIWVENKDAIKNPAKDGFQKAQEYNRLRQELLNLPTASKQAKEEKIKALDFAVKNKDLLDVSAFDNAMGLHNLPINDPRRKNIDLVNMPLLAKPLTPQEKQNYIKSVLSPIGKQGSFGQAKQIDKYTTETPYTEEYTNSALKMAADKVKVDASSNLSLKRTAELDFSKMPVEAQLELDKLHKEFYGKPIQNASDMIAAEILQAGRLAKKVTPKKEKDWEAQRDLIFSQSLAKIAANQSLDQYSPEYHLEKIYNAGSEDPDSYFIKGQEIKGKEISLPDALEDKYFDKYQGRKIRPDKIIMTDDKSKIYLIKFSGDKTKSGNKIINSSLTRKIDVGTDLVPALGDLYGGKSYTRRNILTGEQQKQQSKVEAEKPKSTKSSVVIKGKKDDKL